MKKIITKILIITIAFLIASIGFAASLDSNNFDVLLVKKNYDNYGKTVNISDGDILKFNIHFYANNGNITNLNAYLGDLSGTTINGSKSISAYVNASNASRINDSVNIYSNNQVELIFQDSSFQLNSCQSESCESANGYRANYTIATFPEGQWGNAVFSYRVVDVENNDDNDDDDDTDYIDIDTRSATDVDEDSAKLRGRVSEGDNVDVWFAISRTDSTPECSDSSEKEYVSGDYDDGDYFYKTVRSLRDDTKYHYRACGENNDDDSYGSVYSFTTDDEGNNNDNNDEYDYYASTNTPTSVGYTTVKLNGYADLGSEDEGTVYFQYGTTYLGSKTPDLRITRDTSFISTLTGLASDTTYYYRAYIEDEDGNEKRGILRSFRTLKYSTGVIITPVTPRIIEDTITVYVQEEVQEDLEIKKYVSNERDYNYTYQINADLGDVVYYKVRVKNNTDKTITNVKVTDSIPYELELDNSKSTDDHATKYLTWKIPELRPGESRVFTAEMRVAEGNMLGNVISSKAEIQADNYKTTDSNDVDIYIGNQNQIFTGNQEANIFGLGSNFLPTTLIGYLILLTFILGITFLVTLLFGKTNNSARQTLNGLKGKE